MNRVTMKTINTAKLNKFLEISANFTILAIGLFVAGLITWHLYQYVQSSEIANTGGQNTAIKNGQILPQIPNVDFSKSERALVVAMDANCIHCKKSVQFLNSIKAESSTFTKSTQIVAVFPNTKSEVEVFNKTYRFQVESVSEAQRSSLNVQGTPTMILVDQKGTILDSWVGAIPEASKSKVLARLAS